MSDSRRTGLTEEELETLANKLIEKITVNKACGIFTAAEHQEIRSILATKKRAVKVTLWVAGLITLWVIKDVYFWITSHLSWGK